MGGLACGLEAIMHINTKISANNQCNSRCPVSALASSFSASMCWNACSSGSSADVAAPPPKSRIATATATAEDMLNCQRPCVERLLG